MRSLHWLIAAAIAGASACSSVETGIPGGSGGGGSGVDGGTAGGGGNADGGSDAGTGGTIDCDGLAPASLGTMASYAEPYDSTSGVCGLPVGNGAGVMAHFVSGNAYPRFTLVNSSSGVNGRVATVAHGGIITAGPASPAPRTSSSCPGAETPARSGRWNSPARSHLRHARAPSRSRRGPSSSASPSSWRATATAADG